jgi:hypothetical protein
MYILLATIILTIGFYALYNTSVKALLPGDTVSVWLQRNRNLSRAGGILCLLFAFVLFVLEQGVGAGILSGCILLMVVACLIVILCPLITQKH